MKKIGVVQNLFGTDADVAVVRDTACGETCASCSGACQLSETVVRAKNQAGALVGDTVLVELESAQVLRVAFIVYMIPLLLLFAGYGIGYGLFKAELFGILAGILLMALGIIVIRAHQVRITKDQELVITEIVRAASKN